MFWTNERTNKRKYQVVQSKNDWAFNLLIRTSYALMLKPFIFVEINRNKWGFHLSTMCTCVTNGGALSSPTVPRTHVYYNLHNKFFWLRLNHFLRVFLMAHRVHCESATRIRILCVICRPFSKLSPREFNQHKRKLYSRKLFTCCNCDAAEKERWCQFKGAQHSFRTLFGISLLFSILCMREIRWWERKCDNNDTWKKTTEWNRMQTKAFVRERIVQYFPCGIARRKKLYWNSRRYVCIGRVWVSVCAAVTAISIGERAN